MAAVPLDCGSAATVRQDRYRPVASRPISWSQRSRRRCRRTRSTECASTRLRGGRDAESSCRGAAWGQRFTGGIERGHQRMEPAHGGRRRVFLLRMHADEGGVDVNHKKPGSIPTARAFALRAAASVSMLAGSAKQRGLTPLHRTDRVDGPLPPDQRSAGRHQRSSRPDRPALLPRSGPCIDPWFRRRSLDRRRTIVLARSPAAHLPTGTPRSLAPVCSPMTARR